MQARHTPKSKRSSAIASSWWALVAATTLGLPQIYRVRAEVSSDFPAVMSQAAYRLVVQSYAADAVEAGIPLATAKPLASAQRAVTAEELQSGVAIDIFGEGELGDAVVVAWLEPGEADLDFDALNARPGAAALYGTALASGEPKTRIILRRPGAPLADTGSRQA